MPHETFKKIIRKIPAFQYGKKQEERQSKTEQGRKLLEGTKDIKGRFKVLRSVLKKKWKWDE